MNFSDFSDYDNCERPGVALPKLAIDRKHYDELGLSYDVSNSEFLRALMNKGIKDRGVDKLANKKEYYDRGKLELDLFEEIGMVDYILALFGIISFCRENDIPIGDGRGSAGGSLVFYLLGITGIDPLEFNLFLERFVSKDRVRKVAEVDGVDYFDGGMLMDCDLDIDYDRRDEVIKYIENTYPEKTAKILTLTTLSSKNCIRETSKYFLGVDEVQANRISDMIPKKFGKVLALEDAVKESESFKKWSEENADCYKSALKIENLIKNYGVHACGIVVGAEKLEDLMPLQKTKSGDLVSGYEMNDVSEVSVKFDILGLRTLSICDSVCKNVGIKLSDINFRDKFIYDQLQTLEHPYGLFQISADTNFRVCQKVKPKDIHELSDVLAMARPASLQFVEEYVKQKSNLKSLGVHPKLDKILSETKNVILYQETILQILKEIFGFSGENAEKIRRGIGKKKIKEIQPFKKAIFQFGENNNCKNLSKYFWKVLEDSANYGFNKCLSPDSIVEREDGFVPICEIEVGDRILAFDASNNKNHFVDVVNKFEQEAEIYEFEMEDGRKISCSMEHKFLTKHGMKPIREILENNYDIVCIE